MLKRNHPNASHIFSFYLLKNILIHFVLSHSSIFLFFSFLLYKYYGSSSSTSQSEVEEDANEDSSKKEKDAKKASSEKEEDESKKLGKEIVKEITEAILEEALELAAEYIERASSASESIEQFKGQARLPKFAVPIRYNIWLKPDLNACKFAGSVAIELNIVADTSFIVLNAAELSVDTASVSFTHSSNSNVRIRISYHLFFLFLRLI